MAATATTIERKGPSYILRPYRDDDREGLLTLLGAVWERPRPADPFDVTYGPNAVLNAAPIVIAEADGELVGGPTSPIGSASESATWPPPPTSSASSIPRSRVTSSRCGGT